MRIITGKFKGRIIATVRDNSVRPATDQVKGTIFNVLQNRLNLHGADVLDLFAGSGSLGFEAMSRGAARVVFVDESSEVLDVLEKNAITLGCLESCEIIQSDAVSYLGRTRDQFDLIFVDPPYSYEETPDFPRMICEHRLLKGEGFLIMEHAKQTLIPPSPLYEQVVQKEFGNTRVSFFVHPS